MPHPRPVDELVLAVAGGGLIAQSFGGTPVYPPSADPAAQHLYELVEDMALAAGAAELPPPVKHAMTLMAKAMTSTTYWL